jgi:hypothetical protein
MSAFFLFLLNLKMNLCEISAVGCFGWVIILTFAESRSYCGKVELSVLLLTINNLTMCSFNGLLQYELTICPSQKKTNNVFFQRNGAKLFAVGTSASLVSLSECCCNVFDATSSLLT